MIAQGLHIGWQHRGWYIGWQKRKSSVCTRQRKQQQERAAHTLQVTAIEFSSQRAYHLNNNTRVQTQGLSQSSSALLPPLCVLNQIGRSRLKTWGFNSWVLNTSIFFAGNFEFWSQNLLFFEKKAHTLRVTKGGVGWLVGGAYGLLLGMYVMVKK